MAVRMKDIAKRCHVSIKTVSNVINHLPNVGEETRQAVLEAIRELTGQLAPNTAMLVKASHAMHFEWIVEELCKAYD